MKMTETSASSSMPRIYRATVSRRRTVTLPADLRRRLGIEAGDVVELEVVGKQVILRRFPSTPTPPARGLLRDYFANREDVQRFLNEERRGWEDDDHDSEDT